MKDLVLHAATRQQLQTYLENPTHAAILVGPTGSGKLTLATKLAEVSLGLAKGSFANHPYKLIISPQEGKSIGIEAVRSLEQFLALKVPNQSKYNRAIIFENGHLLTTEAQNALLKTLEEPPEGTLILLTVNSEHALLPTIRSRAQPLIITRPEAEAITDYFTGKGMEQKAIKQAYAISGGLPGLMHALLSDEEHPLTQATVKARQLLSQSTYERLLSVDELAKQRPLASDVAFILQQMAHVSLQTASGPSARKWQNIMATSYQAAEALATSAQPKLTLTKLMISL